MYDWKFLKVSKFEFPLIIIGNLDLGGTGKSPHAMFIANLLAEFNPAFLSRGYGRSTHGVIEAENSTIVEDLGDEPMMFHNRFPESRVVVSEKRIDGVKHLLSNGELPGCIILDDAFQHRKIDSSMKILLFTYSSLFLPSYLVPSGNRRDLMSRYTAATLIIVTNCPSTIDSSHTDLIQAKFKSKKVFYSRMGYQNWKNFNGVEIKPDDLRTIPAIALSAIARPEAFETMAKERFNVQQVLRKKDHHNYTFEDIQSLRKNMAKFADRGCLLVSTEKDMVKLISHMDEELKSRCIYPEVTVSIEKSDELTTILKTYVKSYSRNHGLHPISNR